MKIRVLLVAKACSSGLSVSVLQNTVFLALLTRSKITTITPYRPFFQFEMHEMSGLLVNLYVEKSLSQALPFQEKTVAAA